MTHSAVLSAFAVLAVLASCRNGMRVRDSVVPVRCTELRFPEPWDPPDAFKYGGEYWQETGYLYLKRSSTGEVLVAKGEGLAMLSKQIYATSPRAQWALRRVTKEEWDAGQFLGSGENKDVLIAEAHEGYDFASRTVRLNRKTLQYSGDAFADSIRSPSGKLLAVASYSGSVPAALFHELPRWASGDYYFDVFQLETGRRLASIKGSYSNVHPAQYLYGFFWAGDRFFVRTVENNREHPVICEIEQ